MKATVLRESSTLARGLMITTKPATVFVAFHLLRARLTYITDKTLGTHVLWLGPFVVGGYLNRF